MPTSSDTLGGFVGLIGLGDAYAKATEEQETVQGRFWRFFIDVPWCLDRNEWEAMEPTDIAKFISEKAVPEFQAEFARVQRELEVVPTKSAILGEIVQRCRALADWTEKWGRQSPFYQGRDLSPYITKPREVALLLEEIKG